MDDNACIQGEIWIASALFGSRLNVDHFKKSPQLDVTDIE